MTISVASDASCGIAASVIESIGRRFGVTEGADFVNGDGIAKPLGFVQWPTPLAARGQ